MESFGNELKSLGRVKRIYKRIEIKAEVQMSVVDHHVNPQIIYCIWPDLLGHV